MGKKVWTLENLPTWKECEERASAGEANVLHRFIQGNEPQGESEEEFFRQGLCDVLNNIENL